MVIRSSKQAPPSFGVSSLTPITQHQQGLLIHLSTPSDDLLQALGMAIGSGKQAPHCLRVFSLPCLPSLSKSFWVVGPSQHTQP